jgi:hypothetical protein
VAPAGTAAASVSTLLSRPITGALPIDGTVLRHQSARPGQQGRYTFSGTTGQGWALSATSDATFSGTITVSQPSGSTIVSSYVGTNAVVKLDLTPLPATGTYTVVVNPSGMATGAVDLRLVADATGTLTIGAAAAVLPLATGQNGRYTFSGNTGDQLGFALTALTTTPSGQYVSLTIYKPDGTGLWSSSTSSATAWQMPALPTTGTYALKVIPNGTSSASLTVILSRPLTGTIATDGTTTRFETTRPAQTGRYTFAGTAGSGWTLQATPSATLTGYVYVYQPSGATIASASLPANTSVKLDLGLLPATGTYTVAINLSGLAIGSVDMRLVAEAVGTLTIGAATTTLTLGTAQNGRYTFGGASGDLLSLAITSLSTVPSGTSVTFTILKPDGSTLSWNAASVPTTWQLPTLAATGTYALRVLPGGTASATIGVEIRRR